MSSVSLIVLIALAGAAVPPWPGLTPGSVNIASIEDDAPTLRLTVAIFSGSASDPAGLEGLAAVTARLVTEAARASVTPTGGDSGPAAIVDQLVDRDMTRIRLAVESDLLEAPYRRLVAGLLHPIADDAIAFPSGRGAEPGRDDAPLTIAERAFDAIVHTGHPSTDPAEDAASTTVTPEDVLGFHARHYRKGNIFITVAGATASSLAARLKRDLADLPDGVTDHELSPASYLVKPRFYLIRSADASRTRFVLGHPLDVPEGHPDAAPVRIALEYLASGGGALLAAPLPRLRGRLGVTLETEPGEAAGRVLSLLTRFDRLLSAPLPDEDLEALKTAALASRGMSRGALGALPAPILEIFERMVGQEERFEPTLMRVTGRDLRDAAARHIRPGRLAILGVTRDPDSLAGSLVAAGVDPRDIEPFDGEAGSEGE